MRACFATGPYGAQPPALALPNATPRYASGPATFFRCNYEPWRATEADIAIVGVPFDGGATKHPVQSMILWKRSKVQGPPQRCAGQ